MVELVRKKAPTGWAPRDEESADSRTPMQRCETMLEALEKHYGTLMPGASFSEFKSLVWKGYNGKLSRGRVSGDAFITALLELDPAPNAYMPSDPGVRAKWVALFAATAYCYEAKNALGREPPERGDYEYPEEFAEAATEYFSDQHEPMGYVIDAALWHGFVTGLMWVEDSAAAAIVERFLREERSRMATEAAHAMHKNSPKQADKAHVKECWDAWQLHPDRYKSDAAFAKDMLEKYTSLRSVVVITRWCREWRKGQLT